MRINTNVSSLVAQESATNTGKVISSSLEKLSSGLRINKASDDASGLAIADKLRTQVTSINQGISNNVNAMTVEEFNEFRKPVVLNLNGVITPKKDAKKIIDNM